MEVLKFQKAIFGSERGLADAVNAALGVKLVADTDTDTVNGHINACRMTESGVCPMCLEQVDSGHECCEVVLYDAPSERGRPHGLSAAQLRRLGAIVTNFG